MLWEFQTPSAAFPGCLGMLGGREGPRGCKMHLHVCVEH